MSRRSFIPRAGTALRVRIATEDIGERELPVYSDQQLGERDRIAAALAPIHAHDDLLEHPGFS